MCELLLVHFFTDLILALLTLHSPLEFCSVHPCAALLRDPLLSPFSLRHLQIVWTAGLKAHARLMAAPKATAGPSLITERPNRHSATAGLSAVCASPSTPQPTETHDGFARSSGSRANSALQSRGGEGHAVGVLARSPREKKIIRIEIYVQHLCVHAYKEGEY